MTIGELAKKTGVWSQTLRYYEREGLLPPPPRAREPGAGDIASMEANLREFGLHPSVCIRCFN